MSFRKSLSSSVDETTFFEMQQYRESTEEYSRWKVAKFTESSGKLVSTIWIKKMSKCPSIGVLSLHICTICRYPASNRWGGRTRSMFVRSFQRVRRQISDKNQEMRQCLFCLLLGTNRKLSSGVLFRYVTMQESSSQGFFLNLCPHLTVLSLL